MPSSYSRSFYSATICVYSTHTDSTILRIYRDALYGLIFWLSMRENHVYNIEVQRNDKGAGVKRARYNSSLIDANVTEPGDEYEKLNETYVIFITENDVLGGGHQSIILIGRSKKPAHCLGMNHILYM